MIIFLLLLLVIIAIIIIAIYNGIISLKNNVARSWSDIIAYERQKIKLLPDLERISSKYLDHEKSLLISVTSLRSAIAAVSPGSIDTKALSDIEQKTQSVLSGFKAVAEAYPNLQSADVLRDLMAEMIELEENITAAVTIFNRNVADFNTGIEVFPNSIINSLTTRLSPVPIFSDSSAEYNFEYKFNAQ